MRNAFFGTWTLLYLSLPFITIDRDIYQAIFFPVSFLTLIITLYTNNLFIIKHPILYRIL